MRYPRTNARLLVFARYGPADDEGRMYGGPKRTHVLTHSELMVMIEDEERQELMDILWDEAPKRPAAAASSAGFGLRARNPALSRDEEDRLINALREKIPQMTVQLLERLLHQEIGDGEARTFHAVQQLLLSEQKMRLKRLRALFPKPDERFIDRIKLKLHDLYINPPKREDRDVFSFSDNMISKNGSLMVQLEDVNDPVSKLNVSLLRDDCGLKTDRFRPPPSNVYLASAGPGAGGDPSKKVRVSDRVLFTVEGKARYIKGTKQFRASQFPDLIAYKDQPWYD